jgi:uncharacterized protein (DUF58 family)
MALFDTELLNSLPNLSVASRQARGGLLAAPRTRLPAGGTELTGHRDYAPGDDYRHVDWNLCARHDELLVKQFQGESDCPVYLLLDGSRSMSLGRPAKFDVARQAVAALAYVALADLERVEVLVFADRIVAGLGPLRDKARILKLVRFLETLSPTPKRTDLAAAAEGFVGRRQRRGLAVVVSDLCDPRGFGRGLDVLRRGGYGPRVVQVYDPREAEPRALGDSEILDVETGASWQVTLTPEQVTRYRALYAEFHKSVQTYCAGHGIGCAQVPIDLPQERLLLTAIGARK